MKALQASKEYHKEERDLNDIIKNYGWVYGIDYLSGIDITQWIKKNVVNKNLLYGVGSMMGIAEAVRRGVGYSILPEYMAFHMPELIKIQPVEALEKELWLLTHRDLNRMTRLHTLNDFLKTYLDQKQYTLGLNPFAHKTE